jgi:hypothetical protein
MEIEKEKECQSTFDLCNYTGKADTVNKKRNEWIWSKNDSPIRKSKKQYSYSNTPISHEEQIEKMYPKRNKFENYDEGGVNVEDSSNKHDNNTYDDMFSFKYKYTRNNDTKYKNIENKRSMIIQTKINPYLKKNKYLDDIQTQDNFLRPKNSNIEC